MTLTDPRDALAEQSSFIGYLMGLAGIGRTVRALAADGAPRTGTAPESDDFVHVLLGLADLGRAVEGLVDSPAPQHSSRPEPEAAPVQVRWLR